MSLLLQQHQLQLSAAGPASCRAPYGPWQASAAPQPPRLCLCPPLVCQRAEGLEVGNEGLRRVAPSWPWVHRGRQPAEGGNAELPAQVCWYTVQKLALALALA